MHRILIAILLVSWTFESAAQSSTTRRRAVRHPEPGVAAPLATADSYSVTQGATLTVAAPGVLANDTLHTAAIASFGPLTGTEQAALGITLQTAQGGALSLAAGGGFTYTPASAFSGTDTFKYVIRNAGGSSSATVTIAVEATQQAFAAVNDSYSTLPESTLLVPAPGILTNDTPLGGRIVSFGPRTGTEQTVVPGTAVTAQGGTIDLASDGSFTYAPPPTTDDGYGNTRPFLGVDGFVYRILRDSVTASALVNVAVEIPATDADFVVATPGHFYAISGNPGENPVIRLTRGRTYTFQISASPVHPFAILDAPQGSVTNNNITQGTLTFIVPAAAQSYRYRCTTHGFGNVIETVP